MRALAGVLLALALATPLSAQFGYFGQNKIQYRRFDWRVLRGEHVDLYYYPEEEELGRVALAYAEASYDSLERRVREVESAMAQNTIAVVPRVDETASYVGLKSVMMGGGEKKPG